jgi:membrane-associated phospholipid phosphatase
MFEPLALPTYAAVALCIAATIILVALLGFKFAPDCWPIFWAWPLLALSAMLLRRVGHERLATAFEGVTLIYAQGMAFLLLMFPLSAISAPFADRWLDGLDRSLGFDWVAYTLLAAPAGGLLRFAYDSLNWQPLIVVLALCFAGHKQRMWQLVFASTLALAISTAIFPFAPAIGAAEFHGFHLVNGTHLPFGATISMLKGGDRLITVRLFTGFISFPSYHAAAAAMFAWAAWPLKPLRWPLIALNSVMCFAAIIYGGHYLVDILAGLAIAAASVALATGSVARIRRNS